MKLKEIMETVQHYEKCLVWQSEENATEIDTVLRAKYGVEATVDWNIMYFKDKFEFDYVDYHYRMKIPPSKRPEIKSVSELTDADRHKTAK